MLLAFLLRKFAFCWRVRDYFKALSFWIILVIIFVLFTHWLVTKIAVRLAVVVAYFRGTNYVM